MSKSNDELFNQVAQQLAKYRGKNGLYIIRPKSVDTLQKICTKLKYNFQSSIAYIGKAAMTKSSDLFVRSKQEMGWSNFAGATFVKKIGEYLDFDTNHKRNKELQLQTKEFICSNFTIECIEFHYSVNLEEIETEYITKFKPCLNVKKNKRKLK